nr:MAG TPA: hypothetical protein [Caudoviricetes sp.]
MLWLPLAKKWLVSCGRKKKDLWLLEYRGFSYI